MKKQVFLYAVFLLLDPCLVYSASSYDNIQVKYTDQYRNSQVELYKDLPFFAQFVVESVETTIEAGDITRKMTNFGMDKCKNLSVTGFESEIVTGVDISISPLYEQLKENNKPVEIVTEENSKGNCSDEMEKIKAEAKANLSTDFTYPFILELLQQILSCADSRVRDLLENANKENIILLVDECDNSRALINDISKTEKENLIKILYVANMVTIIYKDDPIATVIHKPIPDESSIGDSKQKGSTVIAVVGLGVYKYIEGSPLINLTYKFSDGVVIASRGRQTNNDQERDDAQTLTKIVENCSPTPKTQNNIAILASGAGFKAYALAEGIADVYLQVGDFSLWDAGPAIVVSKAKGESPIKRNRKRYAVDIYGNVEAFTLKRLKTSPLMNNGLIATTAAIGVDHYLDQTKSIVQLYKTRKLFRELTPADDLA